MFLATNPFSLSFQDYPNKHSWAVMVYFQGCNRNCPDCHNNSLQDQSRGVYYSPELLNTCLSKLTTKLHTKCVVFSGGDPLMPRQLDSLYDFITQYGQSYNLCIYTGADYTELYSKMNSLIPLVSYYKGGSYQKKYRVYPFGKHNSSFQLASSNQFFLDSSLKYISSKGLLTF